MTYENDHGVFSCLTNGAIQTESHYRPKKDTTIIMEKPQDLDDNENDDNCDTRPIKKNLPGVVIPYIQTDKGAVRVNY